jgi:hypothetical protein
VSNAIFIVSSSFRSLISEGYSAVIDANYIKFCQIIGVTIHMASGPAMAIDIDTDGDNSSQVTIQDCEIQNIHTQRPAVIEVGRVAPFFSSNTLRECSTSQHVLSFGLVGRPRAEILESTFIDTLFEGPEGVAGGFLALSVGSDGGQAILRNCHFRNASAGGINTHFVLYCAGCHFDQGACGVFTSNTGALVLMDCLFENLDVGVKASGQSLIPEAHICGCAFHNCGQGILARWSEVTLIQSTFEGLAGEALVWNVLHGRVMIDLCYFGPPADLTRLTISWGEADGASPFFGEGAGMTRSCFRGTGPRLGILVDGADLSAIDATVCFESTDPFGGVESGEGTLNLDCLDCTAYNIPTSEACDLPVMRPVTAFPTPEGLEQFYTLPPATTREIQATTPPPSCTPTDEFIPYRRPFLGIFRFLGYTLMW